MIFLDTMTKIIDKETELNKLLTKDEKIKVLKYANEYLDSESSNDRQLKKKGNIFTGLTISRNDNIFKYIFKKIMNDFAEDINSELDSKKYTSTRPIRCSANGIFFISVHNPIFKYDYSNNQVKNFINFLILKPYIKYGRMGLKVIFIITDTRVTKMRVTEFSTTKVLPN